MRRLLTSTPLPAALGLVVALLCFFPQTCSANICWSWSTCGTTPLSPVTPMVLSPVTPMVLFPVTPMVSMGAVQQWPTVQPYPMPPAPVLNPFAPVVPAAAAGYMPYTYGYYTYASTSCVTPVAPVVPTAWGGYTPVAPQGAALPVSPYQFLSGYDPDAPISPATPGINAALSNALLLGDKILSLLTSTASSSPGIANDKGNLLQTAIRIFGAQTGFSPAFQDIMVLAKIADKVFKQIQAASGCSTPAPNQQLGLVPPPAPAATAATITITVTVQSSGQVSVNSPAAAGAVPPAAGAVPPAAGAVPPAAGVINNPGVVPKP